MKNRLLLVTGPLWATLLLIMVFFLMVELGRCQSVQSGQAQPLQMTEHPLHASPHAMGSEQNLLDGGSIVYAQGERPLSDFYNEPKSETPLGDVARYYRNHKYIPKEDTP